jgi:hypothetical protein
VRRDLDHYIGVERNVSKDIDTLEHRLAVHRRNWLQSSMTY